jgi:3-hydroxybutyryl-CoA dehydrogenase
VSKERTIGVIGSGTMGGGIAHAAAASGFCVQTMDTDPKLVDQAYSKIRERLEAGVSKGRLSSQERDEIVSRLHVAKGYDSFKDAECVIEAVSEDLALKRKIFTELDRFPTRMLRATNTSSLAIAKIADGLKHADRVMGMHFFNPAPVMQLVELVQGAKTSEQAMVDARAVCAKLAKTPVKVKDSPGFIGNRVNRPFYLEALRLLETGEADIRGIDAAMREVGGFKMGPFELLDLIGLDINLRVTETIYQDFGKPARFAPNAIQQKLVQTGHLGRKSGRGFYHHAQGEPMPAYESKPRDAGGWKPSAALSDFAKVLAKPATRPTWLFARIMLAVINEGGITADTIALPRDVDVTMELGFHYPQGPLGLADYVGLDIIQRLMAEFHHESNGDERYAPNALLDRRVKEGDLGEKTAHGFLYHAL